MKKLLIFTALGLTAQTIQKTESIFINNERFILKTSTTAIAAMDSRNDMWKFVAELSGRDGKFIRYFNKPSCIPSSEEITLILTNDHFEPTLKKGCIILKP